ncbi:hypothetical protein L2E82_15957 [Cichorium intybus]|uniref:Uncharacterized protein n=1 Tax=Cichorium intybus TaxID=13427 RepID=A0ACB9F5E5_CICIN|nr:hypothetical protein L2E82_15957 [Cichorium intybus]
MRKWIIGPLCLSSDYVLPSVMCMGLNPNSQSEKMVENTPTIKDDQKILKKRKTEFGGAFLNCKLCSFYWFY